jgi:hypothetical protein
MNMENISNKPLHFLSLYAVPVGVLWLVIYTVRNKENLPPWRRRMNHIISMLAVFWFIIELFLTSSANNTVKIFGNSEILYSVLPRIRMILTGTIIGLFLAIRIFSGSKPQG